MAQKKMFTPKSAKMVANFMKGGKKAPAKKTATKPTSPTSAMDPEDALDGGADEAAEGELPLKKKA